jgi:hypothetical protein
VLHVAQAVLCGGQVVVVVVVVVVMVVKRGGVPGPGVGA